MEENKAESQAKQASKQIRELMKQGKLDEALEISRIYQDDRVIRSQVISIFMMKKDLKKAREVAEMSDFKDTPIIFAQRIGIALEEGNLQEAQEMVKIAESRKDFIEQDRLEKIKAQMASRRITKFVNKGQYNKAIKIAEQYPNEVIIQLQRMQIAMKLGDIETARKIATSKQFEGQREILKARIIAELHFGNVETAQEIFEDSKSVEGLLDGKSKKFLRYEIKKAIKRKNMTFGDGDSR